MPEEYDAAIRRRLDLINAMGTEATGRAHNYAAMVAQRQAQQQAAQQAQSYANAQWAPGPVNSGGPGGGNELERFIRAIAGKESGGNYSARNRDSGALGKYQIMPGNIPSWSRAALGRSISASQFLRSPALQEQIARHQLSSYYKRWGPEGAAVAWYAGPGTASKYMRQRGRGYGAAQGKYPSISAYALSILKSMGLR